MAVVKRDRVNRYRDTVALPINCPRAVGEQVVLQDVVERDIDCMERDVNVMLDPHDGDAIGDAIFDAQFDITGVLEDDIPICDAGEWTGLRVNAVGDRALRVVIGYSKDDIPHIMGTTTVLK